MCVVVFVRLFLSLFAVLFVGCCSLFAACCVLFVDCWLFGVVCCFHGFVFFSLLACLLFVARFDGRVLFVVC